MTQTLNSGEVQFHEVMEERGHRGGHLVSAVADGLTALTVRLEGEGRDIVWPPLPVFETDGRFAGYVAASLPKPDDGALTLVIRE